MLLEFSVNIWAKKQTLKHFHSSLNDNPSEHILPVDVELLVDEELEA